jgi:hypothetical protein
MWMAGKGIQYSDPRPSHAQPGTPQNVGRAAVLGCGGHAVKYAPFLESVKKRILYCGYGRGVVGVAGDVDGVCWPPGP